MIQISLSAARENAGFSSVKEVAEVLGVHQQTLYKYENDSTKIPMSILLQLSELYQMPLDYIFLGKKYDLIRTIKSKREKEMA